MTASDVRARENTRITLGGQVTEVGLEALPAADAAIDRPRVTDGRLPAAPGELLVERSFAREVGLRVGDRFELGTSSGSPSPPSRRRTRAGTRGSCGRTDVSAPGRRVAVRLRDPEATDAFAAAARRACPARGSRSPTGTRCATRSPTRRARTRS